MMKPIEDASDEELLKLADDSVTTVDRYVDSKHSPMGTVPGSRAQAMLLKLKEMRDAIRDSGAHLKGAEQSIVTLRDQLERTKAELAEKTVALRRTDPDAVQRLIDKAVTAARDAEAVRGAGELAILRAEVSKQRSEIDELRASKKKLREALERAKEGMR